MKVMNVNWFFISRLFVLAEWQSHFHFEDESLIVFPIGFIFLDLQYWG